MYELRKSPPGVYLNEADEAFRVIVVLSSGILVLSQPFQSAEEAKNYFESFNRRPPSAKRGRVRGEKSSYYFEFLDGKRKRVVAKSESFKSIEKAELGLAEFIELISNSLVKEAITEPEEDQLVIQDQDVRDAGKYTYRLEIYPKKDEAGTSLTSRITNVRTERSTSFNGIDGKAIEEFIARDLPQNNREKEAPTEDIQLTEKEKIVQKREPMTPKAAFGIATLVEGKPSKILPKEANVSLNIELPPAFRKPELEVGVKLVQRQLHYDVPFYSFKKKLPANKDKDLSIDLPEIGCAGVYRLEVSVSGATEIAFVQVA